MKNRFLSVSIVINIERVWSGILGSEAELCQKERFSTREINRRPILSGPLLPRFRCLSQKRRPEEIDQAVDQRMTLGRVKFLERVARFPEKVFGRGGALFFGEAGQGADDPLDEGLDPEGPS